MMEIVQFEYEGVGLLFDRETDTGDLTALWRAAGSPESKAPRFWVRTDPAREIIAALARRENVSQDHVFFTRQGRDGGTWAHWQIALIYAHYLSPDLYLAWNDFARQCLEGHVPSTANLRALVAAEVTAQLARRQQPVAPQRLPPPHSTTETVLRALAQLGGRAAPHELIPFVQISPNALRVRLFRMTVRGQIRRPYYGMYELFDDRLPR